MSSQIIKRPNATPARSDDTPPERALFQPAIDILESDAELVLVADVPGASSEGIEVQLEGGVLTLNARVGSRRREGARTLWSEYGEGDYRRSFQVGEAIDAARISAEVADGQLVVHLPKAEEVKARRIPITSR